MYKKLIEVPQGLPKGRVMRRFLGVPYLYLTRISSLLSVGLLYKVSFYINVPTAKKSWKVIDNSIASFTNEAVNIFQSST